MHVLLTGASGTVGRFVLSRLLKDGSSVTVLGRQPVEGFDASFHSYDLAHPKPRLPAADALVHCALMHQPGKFRGGEGDDPDRFRTLNVEGTRALFQAAREAGCRHAVFLSSRAVYGDHRDGEVLHETDMPEPDTLYGEVKLAGEAALAGMCTDNFQGTALRATGIYGVPPGLAEHKWSSLLRDFEEGKPIAPRMGTEVHGDDLAAAIALVLAKARKEPFLVFNVSDIALDRREMLRLYSLEKGLHLELPDAAETTPAVMATDRLRELGWSPGGWETLTAVLRSQFP
jgi:nucleoside-diphosphate-sugar epimerase